MKKILLISALAITSFAAQSQSIELSGKGSFKATGIFNKNLSDLGDEQDYKFPSWGHSYGVGATFYFTKSIGFGIEGLFGQLSGKNEGVFSGGNTYESEMTIKSFDIPVLFKFQTKSGGSFLELGVQYSMISSAEYKREMTNSAAFTQDVTSKYSDSNLSAILGFGVNIDLTERLFLTTGLRFEYGLSDLKGVDALNQDYSNISFYPNQEKTWTAAAGVSLGLMYRLGKKAE